MQPAHALGNGRTAVGAGVSGGLPVASSREEASLGRDAERPGPALLALLRRGFGQGREGSLLVDGRTARVGARWSSAVEPGAAWSLGLGLSLAGPDPERAPSPAAPGLDVPWLVGWRSEGGVAEAWAGLRLGGWWWSGTTRVEGERAGVRGGEATAGALLGLALGVRPVRVHWEIEAVYGFARWRLVGEDGARHLHRLTLRPAAALVATF